MTVDPLLDALALSVQVAVDPLATAIETGVDAITAPLGVCRRLWPAAGGQTLGAAFAAVVDTVAASVETLFDAVATVVQTPLGAVATVGGSCPAGQGEDEQTGDQGGVTHGSLLLGW